MASSRKAKATVTLAKAKREASIAEALAVKARAEAERMAWSTATASYKGGIPNRTSEQWRKEFGYSYGTSRDRSELISARDRGIQAYRNNPVARTLIETETDNVIGDGLNYMPISSSPEWNTEASDKYYEWLEVASIRGPDMRAGCEIEREIWTIGRVGGDVGWVLVSLENGDSRIQVVPAPNIATETDMPNQNIYDGIRFNAVGRPVAYSVAYRDEAGIQRYEWINARDFVFLPHLTMPDQARGETCYQTILELLNQLSQYVDGVALAAWMATIFGLVFKQNNVGKQLQNLSTLTNSQGMQQKAVTYEGGMVKYIGTEEDVVTVTASQPMQQTPEFIRTFFRMLGQPFGMPLEVVAKDMSTCTFASARIGLLPFYRSCRYKAARFGSRWSRTIFWWLSRERNRARNDPKRWKTAFPEDYGRHELLVNAWDYTDPISEPQSDLLQMDMGTKSAQMVMQERGRNAARILRDREEWAENTKKFPQVRSTYTRDPVPPAVKPADQTIPLKDEETTDANDTNE